MDYIEHGLAVLALIMYFFNGHKSLVLIQKII